MSLYFFEGPAGSGKTTCLFQKLVSTLAVRPLTENEQVLALTKMHGSRRRMLGQLSTLPELRGKFECTTIDSFAWRVLKRWHSLARCRSSKELAVDDYKEICRMAGDLLDEEVVGNWATRTFPIIVIDEMQDSKDGQLEMVRALSKSATCLAAADDFQDLDTSGENAAVDWAHQYAEVISLTQIYRTSSMGLLNASKSLREGRVLSTKGDGFAILTAHRYNDGAGFLSRNLTWWRACNNIAVISPVRAENSRFVRDLIHRVEEKPIGNPPVGPFRIPWEMSQEEECEHLLTALALPTEPLAEVRAFELCLPSEGSFSKILQDWFDNQRRIAGRTTFTVAEIEQQVRVMHQRSRSYRRVRDDGVRAMTIHQAKNREFDSVVVLWPYEVVGSADRQRRLLYNAVTRAKCRAVVIIQDPKRLNKPPFVPDCGGT